MSCRNGCNHSAATSCPLIHPPLSFFPPAPPLQFPQESKPVFPSRWRRWAKAIRVNFTVLASLKALAQTFIFIKPGFGKPGLIKTRSEWTNKGTRCQIKRLAHQDLASSPFLRGASDNNNTVRYLNPSSAGKQAELKILGNESGAEELICSLPECFWGGGGRINP